jgi:hypothetical protein
MSGAGAEGDVEPFVDFQSHAFRGEAGGKI